ncbi:hypothetical protein LguiB_001027 [Lonicera macranthoides]
MVNSRTCGAKVILNPGGFGRVERGLKGVEHIRVLNDSDRPLGRKAEKERKKRKSKEHDNESSNAPLVSLIQEMREEKKQYNDKRIELLEKAYSLEQERIQLKQMEEDEKIMLMDTSMMPQMLVDYYNRRQMEIIARGFNKN